MNDFLLYRTMVTSWVICVISYVIMAISVIGGLALLVTGETNIERLTGLLVVFMGPLVIRIYAELLIVIFRIHDTLREIKQLSD